MELSPEKLVTFSMDRRGRSEIGHGISNRQTILVLIAIVVIALIVVAGIFIPKKVAKNRRQAENWLNVELTYTLGIASSYYFESYREKFDPMTAAQVISEKIAKERTKDSFGWSSRIKNPLKFIPLGADPEPNTYTLMFREYPSNSMPDKPPLPASWDVAMVVYGLAKQKRFNYYWMDFNKDGFADPVRNVRMESFSYETYEWDAVGCGMYEMDSEERWLVRTCLHDFNETLSFLLTSNGYDHPPDEPLPELPKNWWK